MVVSYYPYDPSLAAAIIFAIVIGASLLVHVYQGFKYRLWGTAVFMIWGGIVFESGWIIRAISAKQPSNLSLYIAQKILIYAGPPIYSAAEYNVLGRLLRYVPMHTPLHPDRVLIFFIYLGAAVEALTAAGASFLASSKTAGPRHTGAVLLSISLVLQGVIECVFISIVALVHKRCIRSGALTKNIRRLCIMMYGTSTIVLLRCIFRAVEAFTTLTILDSCNSVCRSIVLHEWYLYVLEALPMAIYTIWVNSVYPGALLPRNKNVYLDPDGTTERLGPGWIDERSKWETFADPYDMVGSIRGMPRHKKFWLQPEEWPEASKADHRER